RYLNNGLARIDDPEIHHGVDLHRNVVAGDDILFRHIQHDDAQIHLAHLLQYGEYEHDSRALDAREPTQREHDTALVFIQHTQDAQQQHQTQYDDDYSIGHEDL